MRYLLFVFLFLANNAYAQTACPNGVAPGSPQCGPDSGTSRGEIPLPPPQPTGEWIKTWGQLSTQEKRLRHGLHWSKRQKSLQKKML